MFPGKIRKTQGDHDMRCHGTRRGLQWVWVFLWVAGAGAGCELTPRSAIPFDVHEMPVAELQAALVRGDVTSVQLVHLFLERIEAFDRGGPELNAILAVSPTAAAEAERLDRERAAGTLRGPLHGVPIVLKDNFDTHDMPTTGGSLALEGTVPEEDATIVRMLREAGAIVLAKTNLHEFAFGYTTISSLGGQTRNPHDPERNPGGSSGGTGAAVASSMAAFGYGTDTCGSVRVPAAVNGIYGIRPTRGLVSLRGILPLALTQDVPGPIARTVEDLALALQLIMGPDPGDPATRVLEGRELPDVMSAAASTGGLGGVRIGVLTELFGSEEEDSVVNELVRSALGEFEEAGAIVVEFSIPDLNQLLAGTSVITREFRRDLEAYLAERPEGTLRTLAEIVEGGRYDPAVAGVLAAALASPGAQGEAYDEALQRQRLLTEAVIEAMDAGGLDVLAYPPLRRVAALIGEPQGGVNCQLSAATGMPALVAPAGYTREGLPMGVEFLARPFDEALLLSLARGWEASGTRRHAPGWTPALVH